MAGRGRLGRARLVPHEGETVVLHEQEPADCQDDVHAEPSDAFAFLDHHEAERKCDVEETVGEERETRFDAEEEGHADEDQQVADAVGEGPRGPEREK